MRRLLTVVIGIGLVAPLGAHAKEIGETTVFARVGAPGMPEGIAVRDGLAYVGTHASVRGNGGEGPSKIFVYDLATRAARDDLTITIEGQNAAATHGILAMTFDDAGNLFVIDRNPSRIIRIDALTGGQTTYATIPELDPCRPVVGPTESCSPTTLDEPPFPDYFAFDAAGNAYLTDLQAATIFRVPPGGTGLDPATIWFADARLDGIFGPNGIAIAPDGASLYFAMTGSQQPDTLARGIIYKLPLVDAPAPESLETVFVYPEPASGPDGIAFGASERLYVALAGSNQVSILDVAAGEELHRFPPDPVANAGQEIPYDLPASIAFNDATRSILVTNQSFFAADPNHWAVLEAYVDDTAL